MFIRKCAWCGFIMDDLGKQPPYNPNEITHGICEDCYQQYLTKLDKVKAHKTRSNAKAVNKEIIR